MIVFFFKGDGDHRDLHVLTHSFPTRRSSDLAADLIDPHALALSRHDAYSRASAPAVSRRPRMSLTFLPRRAATERGDVLAPSAANAALIMLCGLEVPTDRKSTRLNSSH